MLTLTLKLLGLAALKLALWGGVGICAPRLQWLPCQLTPDQARPCAWHDAHSSTPALACPPAQELEEWQQVFLDFYLKKYSGRRLQWYHSLSSCLLAASFPKVWGCCAWRCVRCSVRCCVCACVRVCVWVCACVDCCVRMARAHSRPCSHMHPCAAAQAAQTAACAAGTS